MDDQSAASADESIAPFACAATAVAFAPSRVRGKLILAVGLEDGGVRLLAGEPRLGPSSARRDRPAGPNWTVTCSVDARDAHAGAVRALAWRPWVPEARQSEARGFGTDGGAASGAASDADESDSQSGSPVLSFFGLSLGDPEEEDDEADGPMTLASCGADHAVRLFAVRRAGIGDDARQRRARRAGNAGRRGNPRRWEAGEGGLDELAGGVFRVRVTKPGSPSRNARARRVLCLCMLVLSARGERGHLCVSVPKRNARRTAREA